MDMEPKDKIAESIARNPGYSDTPDIDYTKGYCPQQTMYRIRDPKESLDFYSRVLGMTLIKRVDFPMAEFSMYYMGYIKDPAAIPLNPIQRTAYLSNCQATVELAHNWGSEHDPDYTGYHQDFKGFGHIGISVDNVYRCCQRFQRLGISFVKKPDEGGFKGLAYIKDPNGYWIEIIDSEHMCKLFNSQLLQDLGSLQ